MYYIATVFKNDNHSGRFKVFDTEGEAIQWMNNNARPEDGFWEITQVRQDYNVKEHWDIDENGKPKYRYCLYESHL